MTAGFDMAALDRHLEQLLELDADARALRLQAIAASEPELANALRRLLGLAARVDTQELRAVGESLRVVAHDAPEPAIPGYRIDGVIGRGGMATVYAASRDVHGTAQQVAIKVLHAAILSVADRERFLNEQRILAQLRHPGIAILLDAGLVDGRPYMVLERIDGRSIDQCLPPLRANLPRILDVIDQVCEALSAAHQHFVIHRDIKPGNVLVDAEGRVTLIDFGIAKVLEGASWESVQTQTGSSPLTLRYASPEQLLGEPVGVASDVYQLGLLLYQLLTGGWPFDEGAVAGPAERLRADALPAPASQRATDPALRRALRGDLDAILLKCLQRRPTERYASVAALADDLGRQRRSQPVLARRHTRGYLLRSFLRRHRLGVGVSAVAVLLLLVGAGSALLLAERSRDYADRTERILDTVASLFAHANPLGGSPEDVSIGEVVRNTSQRFLHDSDDDPLFQVLMLERLAELQRAIRDYTVEGELLARALLLVERHGLGAEIHSRLHVQAAESAFARGEFEQVAALLDGGPALVAEQRAPARYLRAKLLIERGELDAAERELAWLFSELQRGEYPPLFHHTVHNSHGILLRRQGRPDESIAAYRRSVGFLDPGKLEHQEALLTVPTNLAIALGAAGRYAESEAEFARHLRESEARLGADFPMLIHIVRNYATLLNRTRRYDSAYALLQRYRPAAAAADERNARAAYQMGLAMAAQTAGHDREALGAAVEALELLQAGFGGDPRPLATSLDQLGWLLFELGDVPRAARVASTLLALDPEQWRRADTILQVATAMGVAVPATYSVQLPPGGCEAVEQSVLLARLVRAESPPMQAIPADCNLRRAEVLQRMGLPARVESEVPPFPPEPLRSRLVRVAMGEEDRWLFDIEPVMAQRLDALLDALESGRAKPQ